MSSLGATQHAEPPTRRVREEVRDGVAVIVVSLAVSVGLALGVLLLSIAVG